MTSAGLAGALAIEPGSEVRASASQADGVFMSRSAFGGKAEPNRQLARILAVLLIRSSRGPHLIISLILLDYD
jgi:hypothetical protein